MRYFIGCFLSLIGFLADAQNKQVLYGLEDVPQSLLLNPGQKVSQKSHFGIPLLSHIHFNGGSTGVTVFDIFKNGGDINNRIRNKIFEMDNTDFFTVNQQLELLNFGWRARNETYFSAGIYEEFDFISYFPKDLAILAWEGNRDYINFPFDLADVSSKGDVTMVYHFGINKQVSKKLTAGIRFKLYSSIFSFKSLNNKGTFVTTLGDENSDNIYEHTIKNADVSVQTSGYASLRDLDDISGAVGKVLGRTLFSGNYGLGVDLGFTYKMNDEWTVSGSILDLGAVVHQADVESYEVKGDYTLNGIELIFPPLDVNGNTLPYYTNLVEEIEAQIPLDTLSSAFVQFRPTKVNVSVSYGFGSTGNSEDCNCLTMDERVLHNQEVGFQFFGMFRPKSPKVAGTLFYSRRFSDFLTAKVTYTADSYSFSNIGFGLSTTIGKVNFYAIADNLLSYQNLADAKSLSLQLGFNIIIDEQ